MNNKVKEIESSLENSFFWIWVKKYKFSFFLIVVILVISSLWLYQIPKESIPKIKYGIFVINTEYKWASIESVDSQVTKKIEKNAKYIKWVKKISSNSYAWHSEVTIELGWKVDSVKFKSQLEEKLTNIEFQNWIKTPKIFELTEDTQLMYKLLLFGDKQNISYSELIDKGRVLQEKLEKLYWVSSAKIQDYNWKNINILINKDKIEALWLSIEDISNLIRVNNSDYWLGTHRIDDKYYSYNLKWGFTQLEYLKNIIVSWNDWSTVKLRDISEIKIELKDKRLTKYAWVIDDDKNYWVWLIVNKVDSTSIFEVSRWVKKEVENIFTTDERFEGLKYTYVYDLFEYLEEDYRILSNNAIQTIIIVLIVIWVLVSFKEWLIAAFTIPLSFGFAIFILWKLWYSLNMLTNFSLVLSFWIAIDSWIVIVEWAYEKLKRWFSSKHAIILSVKEFTPSLISGTLTTIVVFIPIIFLPWVMGRFLSFIPITIILALLSALILDLTLTSAIFYKANKDKKTFIRYEEEEKFLNSDEKILLENDRIWKTEINSDDTSKKDKISKKVHNWYTKTMYKIIENKLYRNLFLYIPLILLIINFIFISPLVKTNLFPKSDQSFIIMNVSGESSLVSSKLEFIDSEISKIKELKGYTIDKRPKNIYVEIELSSLNYRKEKKLMLSYDLEKVLQKKFIHLEQEWLSVSIRQTDWWDDWWKPISIKLIMETGWDYKKLLRIWEDIAKQIKNIDWIKYVSNVSGTAYNELQFEINREKANLLWVDINEIWNQLYTSINWEKAWLIELDWPKDLIIKYDKFSEEVIPSDILETQIINDKLEKISIWNIVELNFNKGYNKISRLDGDITLFISADISKGENISKIQKNVNKIASEYNYPRWIKYKPWWELEENKDLVISLWYSFLLAILFIYLILTWQFNSYMQPFMIVYSVLLTLIWINMWLLFHGLEYSIAFAIWIIAMAWIVVNDDIIFIDKINKNIKKTGDFISSIVEWAKSRLQPVIITTVTTVAWVLPLASKDAFWASISYTIVYWLIFGSFFTLFVTPVLYYRLFKKYHK